MITEARKAELIEDADHLEDTLGWNTMDFDTTEERDFFWYYVYNVLGLESCGCCGYFTSSYNLINGDCEDCVADEEE